MLSRIREDINSVFDRDPAAKNTIEILLCYPGMHALWFYRVSHFFWGKKFFLIGRLISNLGRLITGIEIHPAAKIGRRLFIDHGMGVVIGETAEIGDDVTIYHGVTLGGVSWRQAKRHPTIGNNVVIGAGAKILGPFRVGDGARIGSNSVVVKEVPDNATVVGIPGRMLMSQDKNEISDLQDPEAKAISCLFDQIQELERKLNILEKAGKNNDKKTDNDK